MEDLGWCTELRVLAEHAEMKAILLAISKNVDFYNRVTSSTMDEQIAVGTDHTDRIMYGVRIAAEYCKNNFKTQQK
jgi:hypothetical protein